MYGIRVKPTMDLPAGSIFVLRDKSRPFAPPKDGSDIKKVISVCPVCKVQHFYKTYHLRLDSNGTCMISKGIWEQILKMPDHGGLEKVNVVNDPPRQRFALHLPRKNEKDIIPKVETPHLEVVQ